MLKFMENINALSILINVLDILLVTILFYYVFLLIRRTRAVQILQGLGILLIILFLSYKFEFKTVSWILKYALFAMAVALPIIFQPELRRALEQIGRRGGVINIYKLNKEDLNRFVDETTWAVSILSQTKTGALIVFERETGLEDFMETGIRINADFSAKLLLSIFVSQSPLHDGATVVRGTKIIAASCYLPLSEEIFSGKEKLGTRHRAAIGLTEQTDSIVVVVSEETGSISIVASGDINRYSNSVDFKKALIKCLVVPSHLKVSRTIPNIFYKQSNKQDQV